MAGTVTAAAESTGIMEGLTTAGNSGGTAATVGGTSGASGGSGAASSLGSSGITLDTSWLTNPYGKLKEMKAKQEMYKRDQFLVDRQFKEDVRRFDLQYALQQFALRNNIDYRDALLRYQKSGEVPQRALAIKEKIITLDDTIKKMKNRDKMGKAYVRGLAKGFAKTGGK